LTGITSLKMTSSSYGGLMTHVEITSLSLGNISSAIPAPTVTSVTSSKTDGTYTVGEVITFTVNFSAAVDVGGTPRLTLETGSTDRTASYVSGSGSTALVFSYTVQAGDTSADLDYAGTSALSLNGGTINASGSSTAAVLTLASPGATGSLGASKNLVIDTTAPTLAITSSAAQLKIGETATITFTFSEDPGASFTAGDITVSGGTLGALSGSGLTRTAVFTPTPSTNGGSASITVDAGTYTDAVGHSGGAGTTPALSFDTLAPGAASTPDLAGGSDTGDSSSDNLTADTTPTFSGTAEAGATVTLYDSDGVTALGSAVATGGNWSITSSALGQGTHTVTAVVSDSAGNASAPSAGLAVTVDATAPTLAITSSTAQLKAGETATITFSFSEDPGASFDAADITVSGGTLGTLSGSGTTRTAVFTPAPGTNGGTASITVASAAYVDAAGNNGGAGSTPSLSFDTLAPATPSTPALDSASDLGSSSSDGLTSDDTPTFSGTAEAGATVTLYDTDGSTVLGTGVATGGNWSITTSALGQGTHTVTAKATDSAGNASAASSGASVTVDTAAPTLAITSSTAQLRSGETATITFTFSEDPGTSFDAADITVSGGTLGALSGTGSTRTAVFTPTSGATSGSASITVASGAYADAAGSNGGAGSSPSLSFDTLAPNPSSTPDLDSASDLGDSSSDNLTADTTPTFSGTAEAGALVTLYDSDGSTVLGSATATGGNWSITSSALAHGTHNVTTVVSDSAGNLSAASGALSVSVDANAPTLAISADASQLKAGETATITFTFSEDPGASFAASDIAVSGGTLGALSGSGLTRSAVFTPTAGTDGGTASITVASGAYADAAGNNGGAGSVPSLSFDTLAPQASSAPVLDSASDTGVSSSDNLTSDATPTFTGTAEDGATVTLYDSDGTTVLGTGVASAGRWSITASTLAAGAHTVSARVTDAAGNTASPSAGLTVTVDVSVPAVSTPVLASASDTGSSSSDRLGHDDTPTFAGTAEDGATVTLYDTDGSTVIGTGVATGGTWSITTASLGDGTHTVTARASDAAGNVGTRSAGASLTVDRSAPSLAITSSTSQLKAGESATITFTFSEDPGATFGANDISVSGGTLGSLSGSGLTRSAQFTPLAGTNGGSATITVAQGAYADAAGNGGAAGSAPTLGFDTLAPAAPTLPLLVADGSAVPNGGAMRTGTATFSGTGEAFATVRLLNANGLALLGSTQADATGAWSIALNTLSVGEHAVIAQQTDAAGNVSDASARFSFTVQPPVETRVVDGVAVDVSEVELPSGGTGTSVEIPVVSPTRTDSEGATTVADIPLVSESAVDLLVAQVAPGVGLTATGGASAPLATAAEQLISAIRFATPSHPVADVSHLTSNGQAFLQALDPSQPLLVQTVTPRLGNAGATGVLTLTASSSGALPVALVIDTAQMTGGTVELRNVDFAAVIGEANIVARGPGVILTGDTASQQFTAPASGLTEVYAGGGSDGLRFASDALLGAANARVLPAAGTALLHGGQGQDSLVLSGPRDAYAIETHNGYLVVTPVASPSMRALAVNIEQVRFDDEVLALSGSSTQTTVAGLYENILGRQADLGGFEFWAGARDRGASWGTIAVEMINSQERAGNGGGFNGNIGHDVELLYQALFNRASDAGGFAFWTGVMHQGVSLEVVADHMVQSAEMIGQRVSMEHWDFMV
jgi:hypothetical protein